MATAANSIDYDYLVQEGRIHGSLYTDPDIFQDEMEKVFSRGWVFVGHASEIPESGDYVRRQVGKQPILLTRAKDGQVHALVNRCTHRGNLLCQLDRGNAKTFACAYHGWVFGLNGDLLDTPLPSGYKKDFDAKNYSIAAIPGVGIYRGFIFVRMSKEGISLDEHLGEARSLLDRACDMSPTGEIELTAGWLQHRFKANWKMLPENDTDGYHASAAHNSFMRVTESQASDYLGDDNEQISEVRDWGNGHTEIDFAPGYIKKNRRFEWFGRVPEDKLGSYVEDMEKAYGKEETHRRLVAGPPHAIIFPNLFLAEMNIVFFFPVSPGECVQLYTPMYLKGAPKVNRRILRQCEGAVGPASFLLPEDVAIAERNQIGLEAEVSPWLDLTRGMEREYTDEKGRTVSRLSDETTNRALWSQYKKVMSAN